MGSEMPQSTVAQQVRGIGRVGIEPTTLGLKVRLSVNQNCGPSELTPPVDRGPGLLFVLRVHTVTEKVSPKSFPTLATLGLGSLSPQNRINHIPEGALLTDRCNVVPRSLAGVSHPLKMQSGGKE